jgi:8-oxo-dGTP pyrophosphatase MutT (NUDIX family)
VPKGWRNAKLNGARSAAKEAFEEAGVEGEIAPKPIGRYSYRKRLKLLSHVRCDVRVYPLLVTAQRMNWREQGERECQWMRPDSAAELVDEPDLAKLLFRLESILAEPARTRG